MRPPSRLHIAIAAAAVILVLLASVSFVAKTKDAAEITSYATSILYNRTGQCGNNEINVEANEECDGLRDEKCPGRCNDRICMCFKEFERRSNQESASRQFYFFDRLTESDTGSLAFDRPGVSFTGAKFNVSGVPKEFRIIVDTNITWPEKLKRIDGGTIYQTFKITPYNISASNITATTVFFRVYKDWLASKNFTRSDITLRKHTDVYLELHFNWNILAPEFIGESDKYFSYKAQTNGFSYFAVVAEKPAICGNNVCEFGEDQINCCSDCGVRATNEFCQGNIPKEIKCGDNFCDAAHGEDQTSCCLDCGCPSGETCEFNACQTVVLCGNNICEEDETSFNCLQDCGKKAFFSPAFILVLLGLIATGIIAARQFKSAKPQTRIRSKMEIHAPTHEFSPVAPKDFSLEKAIMQELASKPLDAVRSEFLAKGLPKEAVEKVLRKHILLNLVKKYGMHGKERSKDKFMEFASACKAAGCEPAEIRDLLVALNWDKHLVEAALREIFK